MALNAKQKAFLAAYAKTANLSRAASKAKISRVSHYNWLKNAQYKKLFEEEKEKAVGLLEDEAVRRAHEGVLEPVYQGGKLIGTKRVYSDTMLIFLLKAARPEKYRDNYPAQKLEGEITLRIIREDSKANGD